MKAETSIENCEECNGTGKITYDRPEPWTCRDSPPSLEEVTEDCDECNGLGTIEEIIDAPYSVSLLNSLTN